MGCFNGIDEIEVLASNGKPSVLFSSLLENFEGNKDKALEAYLRTQTKEFKEWFGDSKIIDENGEPLVMYHLGSKGIQEFSKEYFGKGDGSNNLGEGFYFGTSPGEIVNGTGLFRDEYDDASYGGTDFNQDMLASGNLYPVFIRLKNNSEGVNKLTSIDSHGFIMGEVKVNEPNQIKSIFNNGEFSSLSDNIYYQKTDELIEEVLGDEMIDTSRLDQMKDLVAKQMKALDSRARELERTIKGLKPVDASIRQDTINRIKDLQDQVREAETKEAFIAVVAYAKNELGRTAKWLTNRFDSKSSVHRDTLFALSKQLDNYAGLVVPHFAAKHSILQNDIIEINSLYDDIKQMVPKKTIEVWSEIIVSDSKNKDRFTTKEDIEAYLRESEDIDLGQALLTDLSSSTDTILALVDKIYKRKMEEIHDEVQELKELALEEGRLLLAAGFKNQDFMVDKNTGNIITRTSSLWKEEKSEILETLNADEVDDNGMKQRRKYITKPKDELTKEELEHNKKLASDKAAVGKFLAAEVWQKGKGWVDGENQRYTKEFKDARAKHEVYDEGEWHKREGISDIAYDKYKRKYYQDAKKTWVAVKEEVIHTNNKGKVTSREWVATGEVEEKTIQWPKSEYVMVTDQWNSNQYNEIMRDPAARRFYEFYTETFQNLMNRLPSDIATKMDGRVFRIKDEFLSKLNQHKPSVIKRIMRYLKELVLPDIITSGRQLDENGFPINDVGIFYVGDLKSENRIIKLKEEIELLKGATGVEDKKRLAKLKNSLLIEENKLTPSDLQYDLVQSLIQGGQMAINYHTMKSVESTFQMAREILKDKKYYKLDKDGNPKIDNEGNLEYKDEESRSLKRLDTWMRMIYYNNSDVNNTRMGHIASVFKRYVSAGFQGLNIFSGFNNIVTAEINQWIEAAGKRFYTSEQYLQANKIMTSHIANMQWITRMFTAENDYNTKIPHNKLTAMVEKFNFLEENNDRGGGIKQNQSTGEYVRSGNWLFSFIEAGEYQAQVKSAIAKMLNTEIELEDGTKTNVWDAFEFNEDTKQLELRKDAKFSKDDRIEITGQIKNMNKYIHGNHSSNDKVALQEQWYGDLAMQFKRWMPNNFRSRFAKEYMDESLDMVQEGRYRAFIPFLENLKSTGWNYKIAMSSLDPIKQANMRKNLAEIAFFAIAVALYIIFDAIRDKIPPEDEKLRMALNFLKKQADRSMGEIDFFVNPMQWYKQASNPVAGFRIIAEVGEFFGALVGVPFHLIKGDTEKLRYEKGNRKGKLKVWKEFRDTVPALRTFSQFEQLLISGDFFIK